MLRRPLTIASAASLLVCAATVVLWVRSYRVLDHVYYTTPAGRSVGILLWRGFIQADLIDNSLGGRGWKVGSDRLTSRAASPDFVELNLSEEWYADFIRPHGRLGFMRGTDSSPLFGLDASGTSAGFPDWACRFVVFPYWWLVAATTLLPLLWIVRRTRRRVSAGTFACMRCGYDLRATPDRCPECGTVVTPQATLRR